jgi:elongation factor 3
MLDEPTGHLDVRNIQWIKDWLRSFMDHGGSIICTSHDSSFLNEMCTHIIDFQKRKLVTFRGILSEFVEKFPEKQGYFELKNDLVKFVFPEPGILEGVKSMSKSIMKMNNCTFTYPTRTKPTVFDITLECSRASRVAVIGPNGAGKSTAIKLLIGELKPSTGTITKHPNLRLAYVAQHAFAHLERHMTKTPTQYIMWRFAGNEDKEGLETIDKNDEEMKIVKFYIKGQLLPCNSPEEEKQAVEPEQIIARRENKKAKTKEYEVKWKNKSDDANLWVERNVLIKMGAIKMVQKHDEREAAAQGLMSKPLTTKAIEAHLGDFGLEPEHATHTLVRSLSGGQKVKVVLAASLWQNPHLVILDEPTNYLDRDALGALVKAIQEYKGGVVVISHNREFANAICQEKWIMEAGRLRREGESVAQNDSIAKKEEEDEVVDSFGNKIKVERVKVLTDKEKKQEVKRLTKTLKDGKKKGTLSDDEIVDIELKIEELKIK